MEEKTSGNLGIRNSKRMKYEKAAHGSQLDIMSLVCSKFMARINIMTYNEAWRWKQLGCGSHENTTRSPEGPLTYKIKCEQKG
jgi:hypothetical protein